MRLALLCALKRQSQTIKLNVLSLLIVSLFFQCSAVYAQEPTSEEFAAVAAELARQHGRFDADQLFAAWADYQMQQPLAPSDAELSAQGVCDNSSPDCAPDNSTSNAQLPGVANVRILFPDSNSTDLPQNFKVKWARPEPLPDNSPYELSGYSVYLSYNDNSYERFEVLPKLKRDGSIRLPRSIRFRQRQPGRYAVYVKANYQLRQQSQSHSISAPLKSVDSDRGQVFSNDGSFSSGWSGGEFGDVKTPSSLNQIASINGPLYNCLLPIYGDTAPLSNILDVTCVNKGINSLEGLQHFSALRVLNINNLTDVNRNTFTDLSKIHTLNDLRALNLSDTAVSPTNITAAVKELDALTSLSLTNNNLTSIPDLSNLTRSGQLLLNLSSNQIPTLTPRTGPSVLGLGLYALYADNNPLGSGGKSINLAGLASLEVLSLRNVQLNVTQNLRDLPADIGYLNLDSQIDTMERAILPALEYSRNGVEHAGVRHELSLYGNTYMSCANAHALEAWFYANAEYCNTTGPEQCYAPSPYIDVPAYCRPDPVTGFAAFATSGGGIGFRWNPAPAYSNVQSYKIEVKDINNRVVVLQVNGGQSSSFTANHLSPEANKFKISACVSQQCGDFSSEVSLSPGLVAVTDLEFSWTNQNQDTFRLNWSYPQEIFNDTSGYSTPGYFLIEPLMPAAGQPASYTVPVSNYQSSWQSAVLDPDNNRSALYRVRACRLENNVARCGDSRSIEVVPVHLANLSVPTNVNASASASNAPLNLSWNPVIGAGVDYYRITEAVSNPTVGGPLVAGRTFYSEKNSLTIERERAASYSYRVAACQRDRQLGDRCSNLSNQTTPISLAHNQNIANVSSASWMNDATPTVSNEIRLRIRPGTVNQSTRRPDYFDISLVTPTAEELGWRHFRFYATNEHIQNSAFVTPDEIDIVHPSQLHDLNGNPLSSYVFEIKACGNGHVCSPGYMLTVNSSTMQNDDNLGSTPGGPGSLNPGLWWNPDLAGTGWYFYWSSGLRYPSIHENYGNTYDLIGVWGSYQIIGGQWSPVWLYTELKLTTSGNNSYYSGAMYYPRRPNCSGSGSSRDCRENLIHAADIEVHFNGSSSPNNPGPINGNNAAQVVIKHLDMPGMPDADGITLDITNFEVSGMCTVAGAACPFGQDNPKDYLSGLWGPDTDKDGVFIDEEFIVMNWINKDLEGMMVGFYENVTDGSPVYALAQSCRDQSSDSNTEINEGECQRPGIGYQEYATNSTTNGNFINYFYTVDQGFAPTETKPSDFDITNHTYPLTIPAPNGSSSVGGGRQFSDADYNQGHIWFNLHYSQNNQNGQEIRQADLLVGSRDAMVNIQRGASYHDIRYFVAGVENGECSDISPTAVCDLELTWFTDDYYPNLQVYYQKNQEVPQPIAALCTLAQPAGYVVQEYNCALTSLQDKQGTYRFYLINDRVAGNGWNPDEAVAVSQSLNIGPVTVQNLPAIRDIAPPLASQSGQLQPVAVHNPRVGALAGTPGTSGGAASFTIPITLPPGRQGMAPGVALSYNSRGGDGVAGMGWSLSAGSSIHRCPMTVAQDGKTIGVQYTANDRLCLDGQRLIRVNSGEYWDNGGEYRTEIDSYARITMQGGSGLANNVRGTGLSFTVEGKDNIRRNYGLDNGSRVQPARLISSGPNAQLPVVSNWLLALEQDPAHNQVHYQYQDFGYGEVLLQRIRYTGYNGSLGERSVNFVYAARTSTNGSQRDHAESWQGGYLTRQTQRLETVRTCVFESSCSASEFVREYRLDYEFSAATQRQLLSSVEECARANGVTQCLEPTVFEWNSASPRYVFEKMQDNGTPYISSDAFNYDNISGWNQNDRAAPDIDMLGDYNGDGVREMRMTFAGRSYLVGVDGTGHILGKMRLSDGASAALVGNRYRGDQDFNDDGRSDFFVAMAEASSATGYVYALAQWKPGVTWAQCAAQPAQCDLNMLFDIRRTTVAAEVIDVPVGPGSGDDDDDNASDLTIRLPANSPQIADFNGDGQKDLLLLGSNNQFQFYINLESDGATRVQTTAAIPFVGPLLVNGPEFVTPANAQISYRLPQLSDYDGDGAVDILIQADPGGDIDPRDQISAGLAAVMFNDLQSAGISINAGTSSSQLAGYFSDIRVVSAFIQRLAPNNAYPSINVAFDPLVNYYQGMDINGDGLQDLLYVDGSGSGVCANSNPQATRSWMYQLNTGLRDQLFTAAQDTGSCVGLERVSGSIGEPMPNYAGLIQAVDWNQDGRGDLMVPRQLDNAICYLPAQISPGSEAISYCPAQPDGSGWQPLTCPQGSDICEIYDAGKGGQDRSTYKMGVLEFRMDASGIYRAVLRDYGQTGLVASRGMTGDDLFGDGINNVYGVVGCIEAPVGSVNSSNPPSTRCDRPALYAHANLFGALDGADRGYYQNRLDTSVVQAPQVLDLMLGAADALGNEVQWDYLPLSAQRQNADTALPLYRLPDRDSGDSLYDYDSAHYFYFRSSMYVVSSMQASNGLVVGGVAQMNTTYYGYEEAVFNNQGRGFQGFRRIIGEDHIRSPNGVNDSASNDLRTVSLFHQVFPLAGRLTKTLVYPATESLTAPESKALSVSTTDWACLQPAADLNAPGTLVALCNIASGTPPQSDSHGVYQVVMAATSSLSMEPNRGGVNASYTSSANYDRSYDAYGNLLDEKMETLDYLGGPSAAPDLRTIQSMSYDYTNTVTSGIWWLGRMDWHSTHTRVSYADELLTDRLNTYIGEAPQSISAQFPAGLTSEKIVTQVMDWNSNLRKPSCMLTVTGEYVDTCSSVPAGVPYTRAQTFYDGSYGNPIRVTVNADDLAAPRETQTSYSSDSGSEGYFVASVTNALGHQTLTEIEPREGNPLRMRDANGQVVRMAYDAFGRPIQTWYPRYPSLGDSLFGFIEVDSHYAPRSSMGYQWADSGQCGIPGYSISNRPEVVYCVRQHSDGAPQQIQWNDRLNRTWLSASLGFDNAAQGGRRWSLAENRYNARGQMVAEAAPRYTGDETYWTSYFYDVLSRPVKKVQPRHLTDSNTTYLQSFYHHDGLSTRIFVGNYGSSPPAADGLCPTFDPSALLDMTLCMERHMSSGGQLLITRDAYGQYTNYRHDSQGNPGLLRDVEANAITAEYNAFNHRMSMSDPNQGHWSFDYNGLGELIDQLDARNIATRFDYDNLGRLVQRDADYTAAPTSRRRVIDRWTYDAGASVSGARTTLGLLGEESRGIQTGGTSQSPILQQIFRRQYRYDSDLRPAGHNSDLDALQISTVKSYTVEIENDPYFARPFTLTWPNAHLRLYNRYDTQGYVLHEGHSNDYGMPQEQTQALRRVVTMNPVGQVVREVYGNQSEQYFDYNPSTWQMNLAGARKPALGGQPERRYFDINYQYDLYGNLNQHEKSWDSQSQGGLLWARESFSYDLLHRLRETVRIQGSGAAGTGTPSGLGQESYTYAPNGNLLSKSDFGENYTYVANRVQSVDLRDSGPTQRYEYDLNGNLQRVYVDGGIGGRIDRKLLNYDPYNKPLLIDDKVSGRRLEFAYGSNDQRFIQLKDLTGDYTVYIDKLFEAEGSSGTPNTDLEAKLYIGDYAVYDLTLTNNVEGPARAELNYLHRDRLGSVVAMSNSQGAVINMTGRGFDAFGKPREEGWQDSNHMNGAGDNSGAGEPGDLNRNDLSTRGFTGHEHLNETDLIHMNGRVYDYNLGRFLSVDPFIQFPANSQSMNAYSYLMNNPLSGTDPSGYQSNGDSEMSPTGESSGGSSAMDQAERDTSGFHVNPQGFSLTWSTTQVASTNGVSTGGSSGDDMMSAEDKMTPATRSNQGNDDSQHDDSTGNQGGDDANRDVQVRFSQEQVDKISAYFENEDYVGAYGYILGEIEGLDSVDGDTKYWFEKAIEINSNSDSPANTWIRAFTTKGLELDGIMVTPELLQMISDSIARNVISDIIRSSGVPAFNALVVSDIRTALSEGGQTIGGWGGAAYFWDMPYRGNKTVGQLIRSHPRELGKFKASYSYAVYAVIDAHGVFAFPEAVRTLSYSSLRAHVQGCGACLTTH